MKWIKNILPILVLLSFVMISQTACSPKTGCPAEVAMEKGTKKPKKNIFGKYKKPKSGLLPKGNK